MSRVWCVRLLLPIFASSPLAWAGREYPALPGQSVVANQLLVRYKSGTVMSSVAATLTQIAGAQVLALPSIPNVYVIQLPAGAPANSSAQLSQNSMVEYVEPNRVRHTTLQAPNDPLLPGTQRFLFGQWDLVTIQAQQAWQLLPNEYLTSSAAGTGRIKIAVIDTGADCTHPDFINAGGASLDAASGGQILFSASQAIVPTTISSPACPWQDDFGHGTHVSGTIAAATNNNQGVASLGFAVELIEYKALDSSGTGNDADIANAIEAAANAGANIISMSLGEPGYSQTLQDAVNYAWQRNCLVVAAAGNDGANELFFPAAANHAIGVAATDQTDTRAPFSNFGVSVDVAAPGVNILSKTPSYLVPLGTATFYDDLEVTAMATPHVAALAGLI